MSKFKCTWTSGGTHFRIGKVYELNSDGSMMGDNGFSFSPYPFKTAVEYLTKANWYKFEPVSGRYELHITSDGDTTHAVYKVNGKIESRGEAKRNPSDSHDFKVGAELAMKRALGIVNKPEPIVEPKPTVTKQEDKPKYASGDRVRIIGNTNCHGFENDSVVILKNRTASSVGGYGWHCSKIDGIPIPCDFVREDDMKPYTEPSPTFDWDAFKSGKIAVHCDTEEKAKAFVRECYAHNVTWRDGSSDDIRWWDCKSDTCYRCDGHLVYGHIDTYKRRAVDCVIIDYPFEPKQKEVVKLYCVKDYAPRTTLTKGKIYEFLDGIVTYNGGQKSHRMASAKEFCGAVNATAGTTTIVPLVSRPAKVGEWIYITASADDRAEKEKIYQVAQSNIPLELFIKHPQGMRDYDGAACITGSEYLVLDGYHGEQEG